LATARQDAVDQGNQKQEDPRFTQPSAPAQGVTGNAGGLVKLLKITLHPVRRNGVGKGAVFRFQDKLAAGDGQLTLKEKRGVGNRFVPFVRRPDSRQDHLGAEYPVFGKFQSQRQRPVLVPWFLIQETGDRVRGKFAPEPLVVGRLRPYFFNGVKLGHLNPVLLFVIG